MMCKPEWRPQTSICEQIFGHLPFCLQIFQQIKIVDPISGP